MFPNPPGLLRPEPYSEGLRERIWWGAGSDATAVWAAEHGMHLMSSTLKNDETGEPFHVQQRKQIEAFRQAWREAGHQREPRVSVSRSIFALTSDEDRLYFGDDGDSKDTVGWIDESTRAIFGRSFRLLLLRSGVKPIRFHDMRHTAATWMLTGGVNVKAVAARLGHEDAHQTLRTYAHVLPEAEDRIVEVFARSLWQWQPVEGGLERRSPARH